MIHTIKFKQDYRSFSAGYSIDFRPGLNILVGDQGSGKSSLLQLLRNITKTSSVEKTREIVDVSGDSGNMIYFFDSEKDNPRTLSYLQDNCLFQVQSKFVSHGEVFRAVMENLPKADVYLIDEPDTALSPRSCYWLRKQFQDTVKDKGAQIIVSAHNPILIEGAPEVLSLEHLKWMSAAEFLQTQKDFKKRFKPSKPAEKTEEKPKKTRKKARA